MKIATARTNLVKSSRLLTTVALSFVASLCAAGFAQAQDDEPLLESGDSQASAEEDVYEPPSAPVSRNFSSAGMAPEDTLVSGQIVGISDNSTDEWKFDFHGFFRAPMRLSHTSIDGDLQLRSPPVVPDWNFTNWQYTNNNPGPWVEMLLQYGNNRVKMTTAIASYNITSGGFRNLQAQLGIDRAFLTINLPEALGDYGGLVWNVGVFSDRYGAPGRYDAGMYETYLFGRTRMAGETIRANYFVGDDSAIQFEHGIGAKLDTQQWTTRALAGDPTEAYPEYQPYPGPVQQGNTLIHHAHLGFNYKNLLTLTVHYIDTFTADKRATGNDEDGQIRVMGADLKLNGGWMGYGYIGWSQIKATNAFVVSDAIEVLHSQGGWQLANNYFGNGDGTMNTILFQYQFSLAAFLVRPESWWGDGADLVATVFGMYNSIEASGTPANGSGDQKLKWGADVLYTPLPFLGFGARADFVHPDLDDAERSFTAIAPRLVLKTNFVTHEQIFIQYTRYFNGDRVEMPHPFGGPGAIPPFRTGDPDSGVFTISASMWW